MKRKTTQPPKIGLALSGGGPLGAIYEIGALCAMQESLKGIDLTKLDHYVGVSAGGFIAGDQAGLQRSPPW
jgi:predicted acylesterase/phospholipase RssA